MTSDIFASWLERFNKKMNAKKRHVLLLLDNAPCHPSTQSLSNVSLQFLPPNTTSVLQPLDLGIIQNMKCHYRTQLLRAVLSQVGKGSAASISKGINVLDACHWIKRAVERVKPHTVKCCFKKAGVLSGNSDVDEPEDTMHLDELLRNAVDQLELEQPLTREDYTNVDCDVQSMETFEDGWENELLQDFVAEKTQTATPASYDSDVENEDTIEEPQQQLPIISYAEAMKFTTELRLFAVEKGLDSILSNIMSVESGLQESFLKHNGAMHQSSLDRFFQ